ncbi:hypothetical protein, partial [Streptomyces spectabilis]|uniref:hypothetical protein n=1 Tax=Streptomyces spectabilis TaxID=68270 RepID=UPI0033CEDF29
MITAQYEALHHFLADRIADLGPAAANDPFVYGVNAQLVIHSDLLAHRDHRALSARDAAFIDGLGLALQHAAARFKDHPATATPAGSARSGCAATRSPARARCTPA